MLPPIGKVRRQNLVPLSSFHKIENYSLIILFILLLSSCEQSSLTPQNYVQYINHPKSGLSDKIEIEGLSITLQYLPHDLLALQTQDYQTINKEQIEEVKKRYTGHHYFRLNISPEDGRMTLQDWVLRKYEKDIESFWQAILFEQQNRWYVETTQEQWACTLYHVEAPYTQQANAILVFKSEGNNYDIDLKKDWLIKWNHSPFSKTPITFSISNQDLNSIPNLNL